MLFYMDLSLGFVTRICQYFYPIASYDRCRACGRRRLLNPEHIVVLLARPVSHTSIQNTDFVEIFNISLDLSIYFAHFSGC